MKHIETAERVCLFMEKKLTLLRRYLSLTKKMKETLKDRESTGIERLVIERKDCIKRIHKINLLVKRLGKAGPEKLLVATDRLACMIEGYLRDIRNTMEAIASVDQEVTVMVRAESESIKTQLLSMRNTRQAAQGYKRDGPASPRFLDIKR